MPNDKGGFRMRTWLTALSLALTAALFGAPAQAQDGAAFYKGKTVTLLVGYGPGGGYDIYARVLQRVLGRAIPGNPTVVIQNMPGAGSLRAANYLYTVAPKDGTFIGTFARNMPLLGLLESDQNVQFDPRKFNWLGSSSSYADDAYLLLTRKDAKNKTIEDSRKPGGPPLIIGSTAEGVSSDAMAVVLRDMLGFNLKHIAGYTDSGQLFLAMERGELEARTVGYSAVRSNKPDWLKADGPMQVLVQFGRRTRHPDFPNVPLATELAKTPRDKMLIEILEVPYLLSRPFAAPPGVPADRVKVLQDAFMAAHKDPDYLAEADKLKIDVSPIPGTEILSVIEKIAATPKEDLKSLEKVIAGGG
jgi:tripartite-type tricarboxylate transporter receptor subunit TctC